MSRETSEELEPVFYWAVGRFADTGQIAIKLNNLSATLMSVEIAREIATALKSEADAVSQSTILPNEAGPSEKSRK